MAAITWKLLSGALLLSFLAGGLCRADDPVQWVVYPGGPGPGQGKHIVLISGDEEYRSEEALPQLGKMLSTHHGFKCTVLFAIDPATGEINPNTRDNIPGLEALKTADLMIIATRFRDLPDDQMKHFADYFQSGRPIIGLRTATHAFNIPKERAYFRFSFNSDVQNWDGGFGRQVLGETWISHHGKHGRQSTRGMFDAEQAKHPILTGINSGDIWGPTDVYGVRLPLPGDTQPLVMGQVVEGMKPEDKPAEGKQNDPMMPVAWTKTYTVDGNTGRVFTTTMGAATDLVSVGTRRMLVNATFWALGLENQIKPDLKVDIVGEFNPSEFRFGGFIKGVKPAQHALQDQPARTTTGG